MRPRQPLFSIFVVVVVLLAGCTTTTEQSTTTIEPTTTTQITLTAAQTTTTPTPTTTTTITPPPTISPSKISDREAGSRALRAEKTYLVTHLQNTSCLDSWGTGAYLAAPNATVEDRNATGVFVDVIHPYSFTVDDGAADGWTEATYFVTETNTTRLTGHNITDTTPC